MTFGEKVVHLRKLKKWTQTDLANATETNRDLIGKLERDDVKPSLENATKIADALDCSLDFLARDITQEADGDPASLSPSVYEHGKLLDTLTKENKNHVFAVIKAFKAQTEIAYNHRNK